MTLDYSYLGETEPQDEHAPGCCIWHSHDPCSCSDSFGALGAPCPHPSTAERLDRIDAEREAS